MNEDKRGFQKSKQQRRFVTSKLALTRAILQGFPCGSGGEESACNVGDLSCEDPLEKGKATHSIILAWRIPWTV